MKTKSTETNYRSTIGVAGRLFRTACLGAVILICATASAQNLFVSGTDARGGEIFRMTPAGSENIYASGLVDPWDLAVDNAGNLFFVDYEVLDGAEVVGNAAIYKMTPTGTLTIFASRLSYHSDLALDSAGNVFVADYDGGVIYKYKANGSRTTFASGLYHPVGPVCDTSGNLFVADNNIGNIHQGGIYEYNPTGSRTTVALLNPSDRPADLALDSMGNVFMADLGGNIYKYDLSGVLRRQGRTTFGSVPQSARSLVCDNAGNLFVVDAGDANQKGNAIYKLTQQGTRITFASGNALHETFSHVAFGLMPPVSQ